MDLYKGLVSQIQKIFACLLKERGMTLSVALFSVDYFETVAGKHHSKRMLCVNTYSSFPI